MTGVEQQRAIRKKIIKPRAAAAKSGIVSSTYRKDISMRRIFATAVVTLSAVLVFAAITEAAASKTSVHPRPRHSSRASTGPTAKKKTAAKRKRKGHRPSVPTSKTTGTPQPAVQK